MEADQVRERRVTKELNVQVLLQPLKIRPRPFKRILLVGAAEVGIQISAAQHTLVLFSLTLNLFCTSFDEQLFLWCRCFSINLLGAQVTPTSRWPPVGSGSIDSWDSVRAWCDPAELWQLRGSGIVSGLVAVPAQLPRAGLQTPLVGTWDFCDARRLMLGGLRALGCRPPAARMGSRGQPSGMLMTAALRGGISQDFSLLLDFR